MAKVALRKVSAKSTANVTAAATIFDRGITSYGIPTTIPGRKSRTYDLLCELRRTPDVYDAIQLITEKHPDASQAAISYVRLANNGHEMQIFYPGTEDRDKEAEARWREFAQQADITNAKGLDGIVDQIHDSMIRFGGVGMECTVGRRARDVDGTHLILPQWITWEKDKQGAWHAFQQQGIKRVELTGPNFFWVAMDNDVGKPTGKLLLEPSLMSIERQLQFFDDISAVLRRAGYPRNDIAIDREAYIKSLPANIRNDNKKLKAALEEYFSFIQSLMRRLEPTDDIIHFDDISVNKSSGENSRTIDARSYLEMIDPQVMNGLGVMSVMLNRTTGQTETWGTVQLKIMIQTVKDLHLGSKRLIESRCGLWMRTHGLQRVCKFTHNPVDWEDEKTKAEVKKILQEIWRRAEEYTWASKEVAARDSLNISQIPEGLKTPENTAYVKSNSSGATQGTGEND